MFFDNSVYFDYLERCRKAGVEVPIIPGIKILTSAKQLTTIPRTFYVDLPDALSLEAEKVSPDKVEDVGVEWALQQSQELIEGGAPSIHFYVMQSSRAIQKLIKKLKLD
jgi:methylenetetrahydrofolate reductase (NADPH)